MSNEDREKLKEELRKEILEEEKNKKNDKLEENIKKEFKEYKEDFLANDVNIYDEKPVIQKIIFFVTGITNFVIGYALYFLLKDDKKKKWASSYLVKGSTIGLIISVIIAIVKICESIGKLFN